MKSLVLCPVSSSPFVSPLLSLFSCSRHRSGNDRRLEVAGSGLLVIWLVLCLSVCRVCGAASANEPKEANSRHGGLSFCHERNFIILVWQEGKERKIYYSFRNEMTTLLASNQILRSQNQIIQQVNSV
jgi:hypothetical protein